MVLYPPVYSKHVNKLTNAFPGYMFFNYRLGYAEARYIYMLDRFHNKSRLDITLYS